MVVFNRLTVLLPPIFLLAFPGSLFAKAFEDPCAGKSLMLALINRPTASDSACVIPQDHAMIELGGLNALMTQNLGNFRVYPQTLYRLGLGHQNEINFQSPNFLQQSHLGGPKLAGTSIGVKHEIGYTAKWLGTVETIWTLPSGSNAFGSSGFGAAFNGILVYTPSSKWVLLSMIGVTTETLPYLQGGGRYNSFNPDVVVDYIISDNCLLFGEIYGQTNTSPSNGAGFNTDMGLVWQASSHVALDVEYGHRISGQLIGFDYYVGAGISFLLS
jgi:hypothetical protein